MCPVCHGLVAPLDGPGQPRRYCSSRCKSRAARSRRELGLVDRPAILETDTGSRRTRQPSRDQAIAMVCDDPVILLECLWIANHRLSSPHARETGWSLVADQIRRMAAVLGDVTEEPRNYDW